MEALFGKNNATRFAVEEEFRAIHEGDQLLDVFEGDARSVGGVRGGFVVPGFAVEKIFGVGMKSEVPIEIAAFGRILRTLRKVLQEGTSGEGLFGIATGVANVPVMFE